MAESRTLIPSAGRRGPAPRRRRTASSGSCAAAPVAAARPGRCGASSRQPSACTASLRSSSSGLAASSASGSSTSGPRHHRACGMQVRRRSSTPRRRWPGPAASPGRPGAAGAAAPPTCGPGRSSSGSSMGWSNPLTVSTRVERGRPPLLLPVARGRAAGRRSPVGGTSRRPLSSSATWAVPAGSVSMRSRNAAAARGSPSCGQRGDRLRLLLGELGLAEQRHQGVERGRVLLRRQLERGRLAHPAVARRQRVAQVLAGVGGLVGLGGEPLHRLLPQRVVRPLAAPRRPPAPGRAGRRAASPPRRPGRRCGRASPAPAPRRRRPSSAGQQLQPLHPEVGVPGLQGFRAELRPVRAERQQLLERLRPHRLVRVAERLRQHRPGGAVVALVLRRQGEDRGSGPSAGRGRRPAARPRRPARGPARRTPPNASSFSCSAVSCERVPRRRGRLGRRRSRGRTAC